MTAGRSPRVRQAAITVAALSAALLAELDQADAQEQTASLALLHSLRSAIRALDLAVELAGGERP